MLPALVAEVTGVSDWPLKVIAVTVVAPLFCDMEMPTSNSRSEPLPTVCDHVNDDDRY
jgi:hypothetical protein